MTKRFVLNNQILEEEAKILVYDKASNFNSFKNYIPMYKQVNNLLALLKTNAASNILLDTGAVLCFRENSFYLVGYRQNDEDLIPLLEHLDIVPEFSIIE